MRPKPDPQVELTSQQEAEIVRRYLTEEKPDSIWHREQAKKRQQAWDKHQKALAKAKKKIAAAAPALNKYFDDLFSREAITDHIIRSMFAEATEKPRGAGSTFVTVHSTLESQDAENEYHGGFERYRQPKMPELD